MPMTTTSGPSAQADFHFLLPWLAVGAHVDTPELLAQARARGVTHVLDCRTPRSRPPAAAACLDISWLNLPCEDDGSSRGDAWYADCLRFAASVCGSPDGTSHGTLLVHCAAGANRSPAACYAILRAHRWSAADARSLVLGRRPGATDRYFPDADQALQRLGVTP